MVMRMMITTKGEGRNNLVEAMVATEIQRAQREGEIVFIDVNFGVLCVLCGYFARTCSGKRRVIFCPSGRVNLTSTYQSPAIVQVSGTR